MADISRWSNQLRLIGNVDFTRPNPGSTVMMDNDKSELDFFKLLFPDLLFTDIGNQTNLYASKCIQIRLGMKLHLKKSVASENLHWPTVMRKKRCKLCSQKKMRSEPTSGCEQCQVKLCIMCFKPYHRQAFPQLFRNEEKASNVDVELCKPAKMRELRHAFSEVLPVEPTQRRSQSVAEAKEHAHARLQNELKKAQEELKLKDEECEKLLKVRDQMGEELEELTACLFEEANKKVIDANVKRMHVEKLLSEKEQQIEVLIAEVAALKQLVLTSTPSSPNKHLHPQIDSVPQKKEKEKTSKPFWKGHRRSTSHHEFTKEARQEAEAQQQAKSDRCKEVDLVAFDEFKTWRQNPSMNNNCPFLSRIIQEDIGPCLNFSNSKLARRVQECVENNSLTIEPIPSDSSYPRKCSLTESNKLCNYKIKLEDDHESYSISQLCRDRIATVCDLFAYIRYIYQGLVKHGDKEAFYEIVRFRKNMALARLGYSTRRQSE